MARSIPADRFPAVISAAARVFITHGYQRTQVQDVADALGLAKGTLYGYAQSKAALFAAAVRYADGLEPVPEPADLPVATPGDGEIAALVSARLLGEIANMKLTQFVGDPANATDVDAELAVIVTDLYTRLARHRIALKLVDRCAPELPDLADVWFGAGRDAQIGALESYFVRRQRAGSVALPGPAPVLARTVVELCALWAVHSHFDPAPAPHSTAWAGAIDDETVAATLAELVVRATAPKSN
jgi:AcrR family transcriptional regulator